jgi:hypothetical protein
MTRLTSLSAGLAVLLALFSESPSQPAPAQHPIAPEAPQPLAPTLPIAHGQRAGRLGEVVAYVDGTPVSVVRRTELPPSLVPLSLPKLDGLNVPRYFRLYDYVRALGVDVSKVRAVELHGSRGRVATVYGHELQRFKDALVFDFSQETRGKPRARWSIPALAEPTQIDQFTALAIYVNKTVPKYDPRSGTLLVDGQPSSGVPYASGDRPNGMRVYVDGKLVGCLKRRFLEDDLVASTSVGKTAYALRVFLAKLGIDMHAAKTIDLLDGDDLAARFDATEWAAGAGPETFWLPERSMGKAMMDLPGGHTVQVSSLQVFVREKPPARQVEPDGPTDVEPE